MFSQYRGSTTDGGEPCVDSIAACYRLVGASFRFHRRAHKGGVLMCPSLPFIYRSANEGGEQRSEAVLISYKPVQAALYLPKR